MAKPIFILSLPRSGSTLLQRLLLGSGQCSSLGEPSLLLRFLGDGENMSRRAIYWEFLVTAAKQDMRKKWSGFDAAYADGVRELMNRIYSGLADGKEWFIDKTPRYTLIAHEIIKVFPDARFIVLWRHPLAIASSMTAKSNFWYPDEYSIDLNEGLMQLHDFAHKHRESICEVRYEDLVSQPSQELKRIGTYLGWDVLEDALEVPLTDSAGGSLGDPTGVKKYKQVSSGSLTAWEGQYNNWYRRRWASQYFSGDHAEAMLDYKYTLPTSISQSRGSRLGVFAGIKDFVLANKRFCRRYRSPVWLKRFSKRFRKMHGYSVSFR